MALTHITVPPSTYTLTALESTARPVVQYDPKLSRDEQPQKIDKASGLPVWQVQGAVTVEGELAHNGTVKILSEAEPRVQAMTPLRAESLRITPWVDERGSQPRVALSWTITPAGAPAGPAASKGDAK
ncbi:hypothetical protein [Candidatus Corynebacterium faecigallinarum]|uniref:hypothetical protein n=1 Tax=Candidatus Corynebacterium faecigallinarum TaxID=2838528 RepID=UPI003FCF4D42